MVSFSSQSFCYMLLVRFQQLKYFIAQSAVLISFSLIMLAPGTVRMAALWQPFCLNRAGYEHRLHCQYDLICPYCDKANPNPPITIEDTPLARRSSPPYGRFINLDVEASRSLWQQAISKTQKAIQARPNAGSV